jgi:hypothetical protein
LEGTNCCSRDLPASLSPVWNSVRELAKNMVKGNLVNK